MDDNEGKFSGFLNKAKNNVVQLKDSASLNISNLVKNVKTNREESEYKKLSPFFDNDLSENSIVNERVLRVVNYDPRLEKECCKDSIGFFEITKDRKIPTIYTKYIDRFNLFFYPKLSESVFIADPYISGKYIEIDEYYNYMKQVRVNELTVIAQSLGAKHVEIALRTSTDTSDSISCNGNLNIKFFKGNANAQVKNNTSETTQIWSSTDFDTSNFDGEVVMPEVLYFKNESDISALIQMVVVNKTRLSRRTYRMKSTSSSGLSISDSASINSALKSIKFGGGFEFEKSSIKDSNSFLEYTIEF